MRLVVSYPEVIPTFFFFFFPLLLKLSKSFSKKCSDQLTRSLEFLFDKNIKFKGKKFAFNSHSEG